MALRGASLVAVAGLFAAACAPAAPPTPTPATKAAAAASPAPAKAAEAAKPAASPAAKPAASPAAKPGASPAASPGATLPLGTIVPSPGAVAPARPAGIGAPLEAMTQPSGPVRETIVLSMGQMPDTFHPAIGSMLARSEVTNALFTYPIRNDDRGEYVPIGVEQVPTVDNGGARLVGSGDDRHLEVTFKIKPGITWHDGTPTTSRDIQFAWELVMTPDFPATEREQEVKVWEIQTPDPQTAVVVYMSARQAREAAQNGYKGLPAENWKTYADQQTPLVDPFYFLPPSVDGLWLPEHVLSQIPAADHKASEFARNPIGNGPYRMVEVVPDQSIRLEAYNNYFMGAPPTRNIVYRIIPDQNAQLAALRAGEIDVALQPGGPDVNQARELEAIQGYDAHFIPGTPWEHIDLYTRDPILTDNNVRKALILGINRQEIVDRILNGRTRVADSWVQPGVPPWAYDETCLTQYNYDPQAAMQALEAAGYTRGGDGIFARDGQPLRLRLQTTDATLRKNVAQVIQANLRNVGVDLELEFLPSQAFFGTEGPLVRGEFQLGMYTWLASPDPDVRPLYSTASIPTAENQWTGQNFPRYSNPRFDELMSRAANELSIEQRKPLYCEAQRIWTNDLPVIPLFQRPVTTVARSSLANFRPTPTQTPETWNIWSWYIPR